MDVSNFIVKDDAPIKLHKNVAIAKSGIYQYRSTELAALFNGNTSVPSNHQYRSVFNVYRPPEVLRDAKSLFVQLPLTREHPNEFVTPENIKDEKTGWIGWTGDSSTVVLLETDGEVTVNSTLNIVDKVGIKAYDHGIKEVSPGYAADFMWKDGVDKNGTSYQIVMVKINEVNHLALVDSGRGGKDASILDSKKNTKEIDMDENVVMSALKKLFGKKDKILDSMPKNIDKFNDEQKDYLLKETHRLLMHRVSGKSFDSFMPVGYTKDDMEENVASDSKEDLAEDDKETIEKKEGEDHKEIEEGLKKDKGADKEEAKDDGEKVVDEKETETETETEDSLAAKGESGASSEVKAGGETSTGPATTLPKQGNAKDSKDITVKLNDSKAVDSFDPFAIVSQIRTGFQPNKKENK